MLVVMAFLLVLPAFAGGKKEEAPSGTGQAATPGVAAPGKFAEAPELAELFKAGKLPSVDKRLPEEPMVLKPWGEVGKYGGTWRQPTMVPDWTPQYYFMKEHIVLHDPWKLASFVPNVAKKYEWSADAKTLTFWLRKGMKWSDGQPFTADDFLFWYDDILLNKDLTPAVSGVFKTGEDVMKMTKVDDTTVRISFTQPYATFLDALVNVSNPEMYAPKHYLRQFHAKYATKEDLDKLMKAGSFGLWTDMFLAKGYNLEAQESNPECPSLRGWVVQNKFGEPVQLYKRNPYYWKVDTAGNQLPYIGEMRRDLVPNLEGLFTKAIAGEVDFLWLDATVEKYPVLKQYEKTKGYNVVLGLNPQSIVGSVLFNFWNKDQALKSLLRNKNFRVALSVAMNRAEINEFIYRGQAKPTQGTVGDAQPWYEEKYGKAAAEYDVAKANTLLDGLGLSKKDAQGYRLRSDGKRLSFTTMIAAEYRAELPELAELVKGYWKAVGVETNIKPLANDIFDVRRREYDYDVCMMLTNMGFAEYQPADYMPNPVMTSSWTGQWSEWLLSGGTKGEEPPAEVKKIVQIAEQLKKEPSEDARFQLNKQILQLHADNIWFLGTCNDPDQSRQHIVNAKLGNMPDFRRQAEMLTYFPPQWYYKN